MDVVFNLITANYEVSEPVDIGHGISVRYERSDGVIDGLFWDHGCTLGPGGGSIAFDLPSHAHVPESIRWKLESLEPLTLSPSLLCRWCGKHGFIREGKWVPA